jgi:hypothetical protein
MLFHIDCRASPITGLTSQVLAQQAFDSIRGQQTSSLCVLRQIVGQLNLK